MTTWPFSPRRQEAKPRTLRPMPGAGTRLTLTATGYSVSAPNNAPALAHPFKPSLMGNAVKLSRGFVEHREPTIKGVPIGGTANAPQPVLDLTPGEVNESGESWVCVELTVQADGTLPEKGAQVVIAQRKVATSLDPLLARCPLALILWQNGRAIRAVEIVYFNLRYARVLPPAGAGAVRHLFY